MARFASLAAVVLLELAGCAPGDQGLPHPANMPATQIASLVSPTPVRSGFTAKDFITTDGERLPLRKWLPQGEPKAVILALHGFNDYGNAFDVPATTWAKRGIATYAYDQRGFGGAPGRMFWPGNAALATDAVTAVDILRRLYPNRPVYLLGESMGGAVATLAASGATGVRPAAVDGVILSAPAVWTRDSMQFLPKIALWAGVRMFPGWVLTGESLHILASDNIPMLIALGRDPMVIKGTRIDTLHGLVDLMDATLKAAQRLDQPLLLLYGANDAVIPSDPVRQFVATLPSESNNSRRLAFYAHGYHMLLRDLEGATVAADVAAWIFDRKARLPSQSDTATAVRPWPPETQAEARSGRLAPQVATR
jgi:acylglycerol lipase